jgi:branched-chain amino acid transport system permease protein
MAVCSGYLAWFFISTVGLSWLVGAVLALAITAAGTLGFERVVVRPLLPKGYLVIIVATLGLQFILQNLVQKVWGPLPHPLTPPVSGNLTLDGIIVPYWSLAIMGVGLCMLGGVAFVMLRTELGLAMRAFSDDREAAHLMGVNQATISRTAWVISALVGGAAGIMLAPQLIVQPDYMDAIFIKAFAAAVLGGFASLSGAALGGILFGILESLAINYASPTIGTTLPIVLVFVVLLVRPRGFLSRAPVVERV